MGVLYQRKIILLISLHFLQRERIILAQKNTMKHVSSPFQESFQFLPSSLNLRCIMLAPQLFFSVIKHIVK